MSSATASISAPAENFLAAVRLAVEILKEPAYPQDEFDRIKTQRLKALEVVPTEPTQLAGERLNRHLSPFAKGDAQYAPTREEQIAGAAEGHARRRAEVPRSVLRRQLRRLRGRRPGRRRPTCRRPRRSCSAPGTRRRPTSRSSRRSRRWRRSTRRSRRPTRPTREFLAGARFQLSQNDPDYPAIVLASYMFGEPITSRISDRIRNREGLSYGANARITVPAEGDAAMLSGTVSLNPGVGPKVEASFIDELKKVYDDGLHRGGSGRGEEGATSTSRMVGRSTDGALLNLMVSHEQLNRPLKWDADLEAKIQALTSPTSTRRSGSTSIRTACRSSRRATSRRRACTSSRK